MKVGAARISASLLRRWNSYERAQAARALPFPLGRKRKQKGPFRTALRQRQNEATIKPVRRTFPNSTIHIVSNTWEGSFLPYGQKFPHEPRSEQSAMLPRPPDSASGAGSESDQEPCLFVHFFLFLDLIDKLMGKSALFPLHFFHCNL